MTDDAPQAGPNLDEILDAVLFAPIGLTLHCLENYPELVERGRRQVNFAQSLGRMAFAAASSARKQSSPRPDTSGQRSGSTAPPASARQTMAKAAKATSTSSESVPKRQAKTPAKKTSAKATSMSTAENVVDTNTLTAKAAIAAVAKMSATDLTAAQKVEKAGKGRVTVLRAIDARRAKLS